MPVYLRQEYLFNTNPIPATLTLFNAQAPAITMHTLSFGATYQITADISSTATWVHGFRNSIEGGVKELPGASSRLDVQSDSILFGLNIRFGKPRKPGPLSTPDPVSSPPPTELAQATLPALPPIESGPTTPTPNQPAAAADPDRAIVR